MFSLTAYLCESAVNVPTNIFDIQPVGGLAVGVSLANLAPPRNYSEGPVLQEMQI